MLSDGDDGDDRDTFRVPTIRGEPRFPEVSELEPYRFPSSENDIVVMIMVCGKAGRTISIAYFRFFVKLVLQSSRIL